MAQEKMIKLIHQIRMLRLNLETHCFLSLLFEL